MQELTLPINQFLDQNQFYKNSLIIVSSLMIDITAFISTARFIIFEPNFKLPLTMLAMYIFRGVLQSLFFMRFPTNYIWGSPGFFSITVPYAPANDFFFSGHLGLCTICFIYFKRKNITAMKYFSLITIFLEFFVLLVTRAHYFIDLVIGIVVAHYFYLIGDWIQEYFDKKNLKEKLKYSEFKDSAERNTHESVHDIHDEIRTNGKSHPTITSSE